MAIWTDAPGWEKEFAAVKEIYPEASYFRRKNAFGDTVGVLRVLMAPVPIRDELSVVLVDLECENLVTIGCMGQIGHSQNCGLSARSHPAKLPSIRLSDWPVKVELEFPASGYPRGISGPIHPRFRVLSLGLIGESHPHMFGNPITKEKWACPLSAHETNWDWAPGAIVSYLDQCSIWLLKTMVWYATGGEILSLGHWIGPDSTHNPSDVLRGKTLEGHCRCGSGRNYGKCCLTRDISLAVPSPEAIPFSLYRKYDKWRSR